MSASYLLVAAFLLVAYLAPIVLVCGLICLGLPRLRPLGARLLRAGAAGAVGGALAGVVIGLVAHDAPTTRGVFAAAGFGFTAAGVAMALLHSRQTARAA